MIDYNSTAQNFDFYRKHAITDSVLGYENLLKIIEPLEGKKLLDYGCGTGAFSRLAQKHGAEVVGIDTSEEMIKLAKKGVGGIKFMVAPSGELGFIASSTFNYAVLNFVLCTISTRKEILKIFRELHRVLKTDGKVLILNSNWEKSNGREFLSFRLNRSKELVSGQQVHVTLKSKKPIELDDYFWSKDDYVSTLEETGFQVVEVKEPIASTQEYKWIDEDKFPPFLIIVGEKN